MTGRTKATLVIAGAAQVLTCVLSSADLVGRIENGSVAIAGETIIGVGSAVEVSACVDSASAQVIDATGKVVAPGFVDSHTHLVFGGSRAPEYAARMTRDLEDVQSLGIPTGILATVEATRKETIESLAAGAEQRLWQMLRHGTTTVESKSGYGLSLDQEVKQLEVNRILQERQAVDIVSTFLGAHAFPREMPRERYVDLVVHAMIPQVAEQCLAVFCDVFCEKGYFSVSEARRILEAGRAAGLKLKIHADEYKAFGATLLAAELGAVSADHLNYTNCVAMRKLKQAGVVAVVMPVLDFAVRHEHPFDARAMLDKQMTVALATDLCPACRVESMQLVMQFACRLYRFSPEEALHAATVGGARALGMDDRGVLAAGKLADVQIWSIPTFEHVIYRIGHNAVDKVIRRGRIVV